MSLSHSPSVVTNNLLLYVDAANAKSYPGSGTTWSSLAGTTTVDASSSSATYNNAGYFAVDGVTTPLSAVIGYPTAWTNPMSYEVWIYVDGDATWHNGNHGGLFGQGSTAGTCGLIRANYENRVAMWLRGTSGAAYAYGYITGRDQWNHVIGTWDGVQTISLYVNGVSGSGSPVTFTPDGVPDVNTYGITAMGSTINSAPGNAMKGRISVAKMYNKALSAAEVQQNFNALRGRYGV